MRLFRIAAISLGLLAAASAASAVTADEWDAWPPHGYLVKSLAAGIQPILDTYHPETGRFGAEPWICQDQNVVFPLAAAWSLDDPQNPWHHDARLVEVVAKAGVALVDDMDADGKWTFRKKDNSTWGQIHMPWTYSRWIRAYQLMRAALPADARAKWEQGLQLGFTGIRKQMDGGVHNIPAHGAMALYIAGECFGNDEWKSAAQDYMHRVCEAQNPVGFWSEHSGPVVGYNRVYVDALGVYYDRSRDPIARDALHRAALFHATVLWPDGSAISCIDERVIYHASIDIGNVGFTWTPEGRGFLLRQLGRYSKDGEKLAASDYAASMLLYGGQGEAIPPAAAQDESTAALGSGEAVIRRCKPWQWAVSAYTCKPFHSRWIQDRQNLIDLYHDQLGVVAGGGNTKLQPYWSTFIVGDAALLKHTPGDESPNFTPVIPLQWTATKAAFESTEPVTRLALDYNGIACNAAIATDDAGALTLTYTAPPGVHAAAHLPLLKRGEDFRTQSGQTIPMTEAPVLLTSADTGGAITHAGLEVTVPEGAAVRWPALQHNPYAKDGHSSLNNAKLVIEMPFADTGEYTLRLTLAE